MPGTSLGAMRFCSGAWIVAFLLQLASGQNRTRPPLTNLILGVLKRNIDWDKNPCDNFFQHVCPLTATGPFAYSYSLSPAIRDYIEGAQKPSSAEIALKRMVREMEGQPSTDMIEDRELERVSGFVAGLRIHTGIMDYLTNELTPEELHDFSNYAPTVDDLIRIIVRQVEKSGRLMNETSLQIMRDTVRTIQTAILKPEQLDAFEEAYKRFGDAYDRMMQMKIPSEDADFALKQIMLGVAQVDPYLFSIFKSGLAVNSAYRVNTQMLFTTELILGLRADRAIKYGAVIVTAGHEIYHSLLTDPEERLGITDERVKANRECYTQHMLRAQDLYKEDENDHYLNSGESTMSEDLPDYEGLQAAYELFQKTGGLDEIPYPDLPRVTRDQLFFYAHAASYCEIGPSRNSGDGPDPHSLGYLRTNAPLSLLSSFHKAFKCPADSRMGQLYHAAPVGRCNQIGDLGRFNANGNH